MFVYAAKLTPSGHLVQPTLSAIILQSTEFVGAKRSLQITMSVRPPNMTASTMSTYRSSGYYHLFFYFLALYTFLDGGSEQHISTIIRMADPCKESQVQYFKVQNVSWLEMEVKLNR